MLDVVITGGTVVDGTGDASYTADIGIRDGRIVEIGSVTGAAGQVIEADGALVTPGWVDVHTHYDGQVTWDDLLEPSTSNGVTTVVMGNCGVGFAPVRPSDHDALIDLMEGVEDIPGSALSAGMPWGKWETFEEYLDLLDQGRYAVDVAAQIAHGAVRFYVMGERGAANEDATVEDIAAMAAIVGEAMAAGAVGFSTSRTIGHKSKSGRPVPGTFAPEEEVLAFARALGASGHGVFEAIVAGTIGALEGLGGERAKLIDEVPLLVFDEVDANVGGEIGRVVGEKMAEIARNHQVLCVTHLPQVAAQATCHLVVTKDQSKDRAVVTIEPIQASRKARVSELARMLGDSKAKSALAHAEELLGK